MWSNQKKRWPPRRYWTLCLLVASRTSMPAFSISWSRRVWSNGVRMSMLQGLGAETATGEPAGVEAVEQDGGEDQRTLHELDPERADVEQGEAVVDDTDEQDAHERADHAALAAEEAGPADDDRGDDLQLQALARRGRGGAEAADQHDRSESGTDAANDVDREQHSLVTDAREAGGLPVAADREDTVAERGAGQDQVAEDEDAEGQD